jgi:hypothetical protein
MRPTGFHSLAAFMCETSGLPEVVGEGAGLRLFCGRVRQSKQIGGMDRRQQCAHAQSNWASPHVSKPRGRSRHSAKRARAERDNERRVDQGEFPVQPPTAVIDLARARRLMDASFSTRDELEMLDRICEVALAFSEAHLA